MRVRGFRVEGSGSGFRVQGSGFRVQGSGFRVEGLTAGRIDRIRLLGARVAFRVCDRSSTTAVSAPHQTY